MGVAARASAGNTDNSVKKESWLPFLNTYRTMLIAPEPDFRRALEEIREGHVVVSSMVGDSPAWPELI